jgi:intergrase/recombinase
MFFVYDILDASRSLDKINKKMTQVDRTIQMRDQGGAKKLRAWKYTEMVMVSCGWSSV